MIDNNGNPFNKNHIGQFTISYELLCLFRWLIEHDIDGLKNLVNNAIKNGLHNELQKMDTVTDLTLAASGLEETVGDLTKILELFLLDAMDEETLQKAKAKKLMADINHIDTTSCDNNTVRISLEKTTSKLDRNPGINAKEQLYKEILRQWQPFNKKMLN